MTRYDYTGRERDPDTGLMYYRARWYDLQVGRFISEDPITFQGGVNWYAYVGNNPVLFRDPSGLCLEKKKCEQNKTGRDLDDIKEMLRRAGLLDSISGIQSAGRKNPEGIIFIIGNLRLSLIRSMLTRASGTGHPFGGEHTGQVGGNIGNTTHYRSFTTSDGLGIDSHRFRRSLQVDVGPGGILDPTNRQLALG